MSAPFVSVVTPFHNTASYLGQCIESVLAQTYDQFEYILVDNQSTDGSGEIAAGYAARDPRIRLLKTAELLPQVKNYNFALRQIASHGDYCKIVQADDWIFPTCLERMVEAGERSTSIAVVSSYRLVGRRIGCQGLPYPSHVVSGREICRWHLLGEPAFGSPTTVMFRSREVRERDPFYDESSLIEDTEICYELLRTADFGFVHQVLSFTRVDNESISMQSRTFHPAVLQRVILISRYGEQFLDPAEYAGLRRSAFRSYYRMLADAVLRRREAEFWEWHRKGLATIGLKIDRARLAADVVAHIGRRVFNPHRTLRSLIRRLQGRPVPYDPDWED